MMVLLEGIRTVKQQLLTM